MNDLIRSRIESIDVLRGIAMVIMALDHVRDYFHIEAFTDDPLNLATTTPQLYFTRWITHICAPIFVFLSGTSIYLQSLRKTKKDLSRFLITRGLWLIFAEFAIIAFFWTFNPFYNFIPMQVIWTIGICMFLLGLAIYLPYQLILILGALIVFCHNILDIPESAQGFKAGFLWDLLHHGNWASYELFKNHFVVIIYPFLPWLGLMMLGYCCGVLFTDQYTSNYRKRIFTISGLSLIVFFIALRILNVYGDPVDWSYQSSNLYTVLSFLKVNKYPPSLLYLCITIGPSLLALAYFESKSNLVTKIMKVYGRTAFFYYMAHILLIHLLLAIVFYWNGNTTQDAVDAMKQVPFLFLIPGKGFGLVIVYSIWLGVILILYPICKRYDQYKTNHKEKWWLSYL